MTDVTLQQLHATMVAALAKPGADIVASLTPEKAHLLHMAIGISGEAGELLDAVKKATIYNKDIDRHNVIEELGDLEFYIEGLRQSMGITRDETLEANRAKLLTSDKARYKLGTYSDQQAIARADKVDNQTPAQRAEYDKAVALGYGFDFNAQGGLWYYGPGLVSIRDTDKYYSWGYPDLHAAVTACLAAHVAQ